MNCKNPSCENYDTTANVYCSEYCREEKEKKQANAVW